MKHFLSLYESLERMFISLLKLVQMAYFVFKGALVDWHSFGLFRTWLVEMYSSPFWHNVVLVHRKFVKSTTSLVLILLFRERLICSMLHFNAFKFLLKNIPFSSYFRLRSCVFLIEVDFLRIGKIVMNTIKKILFLLRTDPLSLKSIWGSFGYFIFHLFHLLFIPICSQLPIFALISILMVTNMRLYFWILFQKAVIHPASEMAWCLQDL